MIKYYGIIYILGGQKVYRDFILWVRLYVLLLVMNNLFPNLLWMLIIHVVEDSQN